MKRKDKKSFFENFISLGIGSFIYLVVGLIGTPIITRLVDPVDYGNISILTVYGNIGLMLCGLGMDQALVRYFYKYNSLDYKKRLFYECYSLPIMLCGILSIVLVIGTFFENKLGIVRYSTTDVLILAVYVFSLLIQRFCQCVARLSYKTNLYSLINIVQKSLYILFIIVAVMIIQNYYYFILAASMIASTLISAVVGIIAEKEMWIGRQVEYKLPFSKRELLKYGIPFMFSSSITMIFNALDKICLDLFCTRADVGVYSSAMNLMGIFSVVRMSFNALWMAAAVEHYERDPIDRTFYQRGNVFISIIMFTIGAALILAKDLFVLLLGGKYHEASMIIPYLMFEPIMYTISETTATGMVIGKKSTYQVIVAIVACITNLIGNCILTPMLGPKGAAISTGFSYIVFCLVRTIMSNKVFYIDFKLMRFVFMTFLLCVYAWYGSGHLFSGIQVAFFVLFILVLCLSYSSELIDIIVYVKKYLIKSIIEK